MPQPTNRISQFWQELKRRKVVRVITVYAAAAFVILELVDMITDPFGLPDWTFKLVVVLLTIGFLISVIVSWIYDIHPEGGIVKTEPAHKVKVKDVPQSSSSWKIASYISFVVIVALIALNIIPRSSNKEILEKSIAVLPFDNMGSDEALSMLRTQIFLMGDDNTSDEIGLQGYLYGRLDQKEKAEEQLERLEILSSEGYYIAPRTRAWIYLGLNDVDKAIEILEQSFENHSLDPLFLQLFPSSYTQNDNRFIELQRKVGIIQ